MSTQGAGAAVQFRSPASVLAPASVALVGASERGAWQGLIYRNLRDYKFPGRVFLVNPRQKEVWGERCFPSLRELPERIDHAMVIVPAPAVADVLTDAEAAGVKSATVYAAAMGDGNDPASKKRGAWLKDFLSKSKIRIAGPNCMGAHSYHDQADLSLAQHAALQVGLAGFGQQPVEFGTGLSGDGQTTVVDVDGQPGSGDLSRHMYIRLRP